jgi:hypothetical protein
LYEAHELDGGRPVFVACGPVDQGPADRGVEQEKAELTIPTCAPGFQVCHSACKAGYYCEVDTVDCPYCTIVNGRCECQ